MIVETALVVPTPEVEDLIGGFRKLHDPVAMAGVPAHITLLYPFLPPERLDTELETIRLLVSRFSPFSYRFARAGRFPQGTLWLDPEPPEAFIALTEAIWDRWPETPPYGGRFHDIIPHCTVAEPVGEPDLAAIEATICAALPVSLDARDVWLLEQSSEGSWSTRATFPLGDVA